MSRLMSRISVPAVLHKFQKCLLFSRVWDFPRDGWLLIFITAALVCCSSRPKGFLGCVFWMDVLFLLPQVGLFLTECLHQMHSKHKQAWLVLLKAEPCLNSRCSPLICVVPTR